MRGWHDTATVGHFRETPLPGPLPTPDQAVRRLMVAGARTAPATLQRLSGTAEPGIYTWFADGEGAGQLADGIGQPVRPGLIYAGQVGAGQSGATLDSRIRRNHLGSDIYGCTLASHLAPRESGRPRPNANEPHGWRQG